MYDNPKQVIDALAELNKQYELDRKAIVSKCPHRVLFRDQPCGGFILYRCDACGSKTNLGVTVTDLDVILGALK